MANYLVWGLTELSCFKSFCWNIKMLYNWFVFSFLKIDKKTIKLNVIILLEMKWVYFQFLLLGIKWGGSYMRIRKEIMANYRV
jgi:hypothetical protein